MTLKEIINTEEKLLIIDERYKQKLSFNEVVRLKRYMANVGEITDTYFELIEGYHKTIVHDNKSVSNTTSDIVNDMYEYNDSLQSSEVDVDLINMNEIIGFINILSEKYAIDFPSETMTNEN
jgi:hypothetical protein